MQEPQKQMSPLSSKNNDIQNQNPDQYSHQNNINNNTNTNNNKTEPLKNKNHIQQQQNTVPNKKSMNQAHKIQNLTEANSKFGEQSKYENSEIKENLPKSEKKNINEDKNNNNNYQSGNKINADGDQIQIQEQEKEYEENKVDGQSTEKKQNDNINQQDYKQKLNQLQEQLKKQNQNIQNKYNDQQNKNQLSQKNMELNNDNGKNNIINSSQVYRNQKQKQINEKLQQYLEMEKDQVENDENISELLGQFEEYESMLQGQNQEKIVQIRQKQLAIAKLLNHIYEIKQDLLVQSEINLGNAYLEWECIESALVHLNYALVANNKLNTINCSKKKKCLQAVEIYLKIAQCDYKQKQYRKSINILSLAKLQFEDSDIFQHEIFSEQYQNNYLEQHETQNYIQLKEDLKLIQEQIAHIQQKQNDSDEQESSEADKSQNQNQELQNLHKQEQNIFNQLQEEEDLRKANINQLQEELSEEEKQDLCVQVQILQYTAKCHLILDESREFLNLIRKCQFLGDICQPQSDEQIWQVHCQLADFNISNNEYLQAFEHQQKGIEILSGLDNNKDQLSQREKLEKILKEIKESYTAISLYYSDYGKFELENLQQILKLLNSKQDGITATKIKVLRQIFYYYFESQNYTQSLQQLEQIEAQERQFYGETSLFVARTLKKIGIIQLLLKNYEDSQNTFQQSKAIFSLYPKERNQQEEIKKNLLKVNILIQQQNEHA